MSEVGKADELAKLVELHEQGVLSDKEFKASKRQLLTLVTARHRGTRASKLRQRNARTGTGRLYCRVLRRASRSRELRTTAMVFLVIVAAMTVTSMTAIVSPAFATSFTSGEGSGPNWCSTYGGSNQASFDNVYACSPNSSAAGATPFDPYYPGFQCVELANRFLWDVYNKGPLFDSSLNGWNFASTINKTYPSIPLVENGTPGIPYLSGDIVSFTGNPGTSVSGFGHVAIVIHSTENSSGNGQITILQQASPYGAIQNLSVSGWSLQMPKGSWVTPYNFAEFNKSVTPPANGSYISDPSGHVYVLVGGAPIYVSNWADVGGSSPVTSLTASQFAALNPVPSNGTFMRDYLTGAVYEAVGGAPLYVSSTGCPTLNCTSGLINIDDWDITNVGNPLSHLNPVPTNGTFIRDTSSGMIYEVAGGAPLYVSNWANVGGQQSFVNVDDWDLQNVGNPAAHLNPVPTNGTFIRDASSGMIYEVAGGAPLYVTSCATLSGCPGDINIDPWDIANIGNPASHLNSVPSNGTVVEGLPSKQFWTFSGGDCFERSNTAAGAVAINDASLTCAGAESPLTPTRLLDTRIGTGAKGPVAPGATVILQVDGAGGLPSSGVAAVVLNVTVTQPAQSGYVTVFADGTTRPVTSNLNFGAGQTVANLVIAPVGADGKVDLYNGSSGTTQLVADVSGWYSGG